MRQKSAITVRRQLNAAIVAAGLLFGSSQYAQAAWEVAHGDGANRGFVGVTTKLAGSGSKSVPGLGTFAPGSGPVIAPDGTVYLGTIEGKLTALHADGSAFWSRSITPGQMILASPAVGADGCIYVIGVSKKIVRDRRNGRDFKRTVFESFLHIFSSSGAWPGPLPFPKHEPGFFTGSFTSAPPNIVRVGVFEVVLVPTFYSDKNFDPDLRVIGFKGGFGNGSVVLDHSVIVHKTGSGDITGGSGFWDFFATIGADIDDCWIHFPCTYKGQPVDGLPPPPMPGVAILAPQNGTAPTVVVSDQLHDILGFDFSVVLVANDNQPATAKLTQSFQVHNSAKLLSPPMFRGGALQTAVEGAEHGIVFASSRTTQDAPITANLGAVYAAPTLLENGDLTIVDNGANGAALTRVRGLSIAGSRSFSGRSMASAAASKNHIFVSTTDAFLTLDANTLAQVSKVDLIGGGRSPPAIGPDGRVYAIASNILFVFPPPLQIRPGLPTTTTTTTTVPHP